MEQPDDINWKEAFWFFYWDLIARDEDHEHAVDTFLLAVLQLERLPKNTTEPPRSWNHLLWHLMRATMYQRGLGSNLEEAERYQWLDHAPSSTQRPLVDWVDLLDFQWDASLFNFQDDSCWVLGYLEECAYEQSQGQADSSMTLMEAWSRNPYLVEFQAAHGLASEWAVPVPREVSQQPCVTFSKWRFQVVFDKHLCVANLKSTRQGNLDWHALNEARHFYTGMLLWVHSMKVTGRICGIRPFLQCASGDLPKGSSGGEQVALCKRLWRAMKDLGYQRLFEQPMLPHTPQVRYIRPLPAKRTPPAVHAEQQSKKFKLYVKTEDDSKER